MRPIAHNCTNCFSDIQLLLDGELNRHRENQLLQEINDCPSCMSFYNTQSKFKKVISTTISRRSCGDDLKDALRLRIRGLQ